MSESLHVTRSGTGEPLLLLHGMGSSHRDFTAVVPELARRFDVLNVDLPGVGRSPHIRDRRPTVATITDAVEATLDAEGVGTVHVLGNSLGARVGIELAIRGRARSVVAISPSGLNLPPERLLQGAGMAMARVVGRTLRPVLEQLSRTTAGRAAFLAPLKARPWSTSREEAAGAVEGFSDSRDYWRILLWALLLDVPRRGLDRIGCPVTVVRGAYDWISLGQAARYLIVPGARFRTLLWAGHAPQSDRPRAIVRLVGQTAERALSAVETDPASTSNPATPIVPLRSGRSSGTGRATSPR